MKPALLSSGFVALCSFASPVGSATVTLAGTVSDSCLLSISNSGSLALSSDGTRLGSQEGASDTPASISVGAAGASPNLTFSAPALAAPAGLGGETVEYAYSLVGSGVTQAYTASPTAAASNLFDTVTLHGRVNSSSGFPAGAYTLTVDITCSQ